MASQQKPTRIKLTKSQIATEAGEQLLKLLTTCSADGDLSDAEIIELKRWLNNQAANSDVPAIPYLSELISGIIADGVVTPEERKDLVQALLRILPISERETAKTSFEANAPVPPVVERSIPQPPRIAPATERQISYLKSLGYYSTQDLTKSQASELIDAALANGPKLSNRQMMVLRFWNRVDLAPSGRVAISEWMDGWYARDSDRKGAWELWKIEHRDRGNQGDPDAVEIGIGAHYLERIRKNRTNFYRFLVFLIFGFLLLLWFASGRK